MPLTPDEQYEEGVDQRTAELMAPGAEFYPLDARNVSEAMGDWEKYDEHEKKIAEFLRTNEFAAVGLYMRDASEKYWEPKARRQAEIDLDTESDERTQRAAIAGHSRLVVEMGGVA